MTHPAIPSLPGTSIEIVNPRLERGQIRHALFDFDGTVSLIREGWQGVMIPMMVELLLQTPRHESEAELYAVVTKYVERLTGKQTIFQMLQLREEIRKRGGQPDEALAYKRAYHDRLWALIRGRVAGLKAGAIMPEDMMVPGTLDMIKAVCARGVTCYLASGTDETYVLGESAALGLTSYFAGIYGALDDYQNYSKRQVIERIIAQHELKGSQFVAFGDGYVEIEDTKAVGGIAVGVASNEATRSGIDEWKRRRLIAAGADIIVPDFREGSHLLTYLGFS